MPLARHCPPVCQEPMATLAGSYLSRLQGLDDVADHDDGRVADFVGRVLAVRPPPTPGRAAAASRCCSPSARIGPEMIGAQKCREVRHDDRPAAVLHLEQLELSSAAGANGAAWSAARSVSISERRRSRVEPVLSISSTRMTVCPLPAASRMLLDLVQREGVRPAGKRVQLHHLDILLLGRPARGVIVPVDVLPLGRHVPVVQRRLRRPTGTASSVMTSTPRSTRICGTPWLISGSRW